MRLLTFIFSQVSIFVASIFVALIFMVLTSYVALAQTSDSASKTISGIVHGDDGVPIPGAHVYIQGTTTGDISGDNGRYRLIFTTANDSITVVSSVIGFERYTNRMRVVDSLELSIELKSTWLLSREVVVTATRRPRIATSVPASIAVIGRDELQSRNVATVDEALRYIPGIQVQDNQINIRGASGFAYNTGSKVLLMIDGAPMLSPDSDGMPFDLIPSGRIGQIEVLKGAGSALYGSGAVGGIVHVITRNSADRELTIESDFGAYGTFRHEDWTSKWSGAASPRYFGSISTAVGGPIRGRTTGWANITYRRDQGFRNFNESRRLQALSKIDWQRGTSWSGSILSLFSSKTKDNFLFWAGLNDPLNPGSIAISQSDTPSGSSDNATNRFSVIPSVKFRLESGSTVSGQARLLASAIRPIDENGNRRPLSKGTLGLRVGASTQYHHSVGNSNFFILGTSIDANSTNSSFFRTTDGDKIGSQPEGAIFGQWERESSSYSLTAGLRFDAYRIDATETITRLSPRVALGLNLSETFTGRLSVGSGFRVPSLAERFTDDQSFFPIFRNLGLRPESSTSTEVGVRNSTTNRLGIFDIDAAVFWNRYSNLIEPQFVRNLAGSDSSVLGFQFINLDAGTVGGLDLSVSAFLLGRINISSGYTVIRSKDRTTGEALPYRPEHIVKFSGTAQILPHWNIGGDVRYISKPGVIDSDFARFVTDASVFEDIAVVDVRVGFSMQRISIFAAVKNVFDYYYVERPAIIAAPRTFSIRSTLTI